MDPAHLFALAIGLPKLKSGDRAALGLRGGGADAWGPAARSEASAAPRRNVHRRGASSIDRRHSLIFNLMSALA
jgi:hypothetical protein